MSLQGASSAAGLFALGAGTAALAGWIFDVDFLKGAGGTITMKANAALALAASGVSLWLNASAYPRGRIVADALALLAGLIGVLTLSEHVVRWDLGIDQVLFVEPPGAAATASPGRMGPNASLSLTLASAALLLLRRRVFAAQTLAFMMLVLATVAIVGYWYGAQELYSVARYTGIAWPTALTLLVIGLGVMAARADSGPVAALVSSGPGGVLARRLLAPAMFVPLALGYVAVASRRADVVDAGLATALLAVSLSVLLTALIWSTAVTLDANDRVRAAVQRERDELLTREHAAREVAERANRLKDQFLATLSHELRTPLNAILGWAELLHANRVAEPRRLYAAQVVARNAKFLARLVEDLLDVSRMATGQVQLHLQRVDLVDVAGRSVEAMASTAHEKGVCVNWSDGDLQSRAFVMGDPERLQQIVINLLSNAVKFTPAGGAVHVRVAAAGDRVELAVRDTGRGIQPEFLPHVFDRFRQEDATSTREHGGLGIGLSIARELAELHRGALHAFSDGHGQGSTFTLSLPAA